jgi:hypothetical protein
MPPREISPSKNGAGGGGTHGGGGGGSSSAGGGSANGRTSERVPKPLQWALGVAVVLGAIALELLLLQMDRPLFALRMALSVVPAEETTWIPREPVEERFRAYLRLPIGRVLIVVGPEEAGKSTAARHALRDVRGAVCVRLEKRDDLSKELLLALGMPFIARYAHLIGTMELTALCKSAIWWRRLLTGDQEWLPTFLVETDYADVSHVKYAYATLKTLAHDSRACRAILCLRHARGARALTRQRSAGHPLARRLLARGGARVPRRSQGAHRRGQAPRLTARRDGAAR